MSKAAMHHRESMGWINVTLEFPATFRPDELDDKGRSKQDPLDKAYVIALMRTAKESRA